jgi:NAD(P)-dependent dehydrogenase (short-subunit alcohol dehydrogenase family)
MQTNRIDLSNRVAVVTGAARGIGYAISERLLQSGAALSMWDLDAAALRTAGQALASLGKAAVIALTKALGRELADTEILVNAVCPSVAETEILNTFTPEKIRWMVEQVPKGRFVQPAEIAAMVAWLSSEECSFSTGQLFDISGGRSVY